MSQPPTPHSSRPMVPVVVVVAGSALAGVALVSRYALLTVLIDATRTCVVLGPPMLAGLWLVDAFRLGPMPLRWRLLLAAGLGTGAASLGVLGFGLAGRLERGLWTALWVVIAVAGAARVRTLISSRIRTTEVTRKPDDGGGSRRWIWLTAVPFLMLALLATSYAPGLVWREEGFAYDVLEYHLQLPREYCQAGRIGYLAHNVYANFPANMEMLYLLAMVLCGDYRDIGTTANMIHFSFALLFVAAVWAVGRDHSPRAGMIGGLVAASTGWLGYLAGLAYVEHGLLFYGALSVGVILRAYRSGHDALGVETRTWLCAGVAAGLAWGCKYTGIPMVALPIALGALIQTQASYPRRFARLALVCLGAVASFMPWAAKNMVMTGDPVFPLASGTFRAYPAGWGPSEAEQWDRGHRLSSADSTVGGTLGRLWVYIPGDRFQRFGPLLLALPLAGLFGRRRDRADAFLVLTVAVQLAVWVFATHQFARFAVVLATPLTMLAARSLGDGGRMRRFRIVSVAVVFGSVWNLGHAVRLHWKEGAPGLPMAVLFDGRIPGYEHFHCVNHELPQDANVLLVGEARPYYLDRRVDYCVAFNRNPFLEQIASNADPSSMMKWLQSRGYTHVLVNWQEFARLAGTYGVSPPTSPRDLEAAFGRLRKAGLQVSRTFPHPMDSRPYVDIYEVPQS